MAYHSRPEDVDYTIPHTKIALLQYTIRFCQEPETLPVFVAWVRTIWKECPYTEQEMNTNLVRMHDVMVAWARAMALEEAAEEAAKKLFD